MPKLPTIRAHQGGLPRGDDMLRLHCNENPYGPPPGTLDAVGKELEAWCAAYPDTEAIAAREQIAAHHALRPDMVALGNGIDELVLLLSLSFLGGSDAVLVTDSTFPGYEASAAVAKARVITVPMNDYRVPASDIVAALSGRPRLAFVCNPHNPTGTVLDPGEVEAIIAAAERHDVIPVFDEAYMEFADPRFEYALDAVRRGRRLLVLRTFSKAWGLASLRVGFLAGPADLVELVRNTRLAVPFNVNRAAQCAVVGAMGSDGFIADVRRRTTAARERLYAELTSAGLGFVPSEANFVLVRTPGDSAEFARRLADEYRILVRELSSFGMPGHVRVTVGTRDDVKRFGAAVGALSSTRGGVAKPVLRGSGLGAADGAIEVPTLPAVAPEVMFNGYVGAHVVHALNQLRIFDDLTGGPRPLGSLANGADPSKVLALLRAAALLGFVELTADEVEPGTVVALTAAGKDMLRMKGFFTWGVGGYSAMLLGMAGLATGALAFERDVNRDGGMVAAGSGEVGQVLMRQVEADMLDGLEFTSVADLGCGDASRLARLCGQAQPRRGVGIEMNGEACASASATVSGIGIAERVEIVHGDVLDIIGQRSFPGIDLVTCFLMLHDLFDSTGDPPRVLRQLRRAFPDARHFLIGDTTARDWAGHDGPPPIFSMEFELVHAFMDTPIVARSVYEDAFSSAGLRVVRCAALGAPSTWLWLLAADSPKADNGDA